MKVFSFCIIFFVSSSWADSFCNKFVPAFKKNLHSCSLVNESISDCITEKISSELNLVSLLRGDTIDLKDSIDINEYNIAWAAPMPNLRLTAIYVMDFRGDNHPRILGVYVTKQNEYEKAIANRTNLNEILQKATKISSWQDQIYPYEGKYFLVKPHIEGRWEFGGIFSEKKISAIEIYRIEASQKITLECKTNL